MAKASLEAMQNQLVVAAELVEPDTDIVFKSMFGGACAYARGRVFAILSDVGLALKLDPSSQEELIAAGGKPLQFEPDGPIMKQYTLVPTQMPANEEDLSQWIKQSLAYIRTLPAPKPRRKR